VSELIELTKCTSSSTYEQPPSFVRFKTVIALGKIGPVKRSVAPALIQALGDKASVVRLFAAQALGWHDWQD
jgi:HEAT repeat protein